MKRLVFMCLAFAGVAAFASSYVNFQETQLGPTTATGTTRARPTLATEGVALQIPTVFSSPAATAAKVTISTIGLNTDAGQAQWYGGASGNTIPLTALAWEYELTALADGGAVLGWARNPSLDLVFPVDGGQDQQAIIFDNIKIPPTTNSSARILWACSNCNSTGTAQDAGAVVSIQLFGP